MRSSISVKALVLSSIAVAICGSAFGGSIKDQQLNKLETLKTFVHDQRNLIKDKNNDQIDPSFRKAMVLHQDGEVLRSQLECMASNGVMFDDDQRKDEQTAVFRNFSLRGVKDPCNRDYKGALSRAVQSFQQTQRMRLVARKIERVDAPLLIIAGGTAVYSKQRVQDFFDVYVNLLNDEQVQLANIAAFARQIHDSFNNELAGERLARADEILTDVQRVHDITAALVIRWAAEAKNLNTGAYRRTVMAFADDTPSEGPYTFRMVNIKDSNALVSGQNGWYNENVEVVPSPESTERFQLVVRNTYTIDRTIAEMMKQTGGVEISPVDAPGVNEEEDGDVATISDSLDNLCHLLDLSEVELNGRIQSRKAEIKARDKAHSAEKKQLKESLKSGNAGKQAQPIAPTPQAVDSSAVVPQSDAQPMGNE